MGEVSAKNSQVYLSQVLYEYNEENIVKENSFFQSSAKPSCIDLFLTNFH